MSPPSVKAGIRAFFKAVLDELDNPRTPSVCLLAGSLSAEVLAERELARVVLSDMGSFAGVFKQRLESAKQTGELPSTFDAELASNVILTFLLGLFRVIRVLQSRAEMEEQIETLLRGLGI